MSILYVLEILRDFTDEDHVLTRQQIADKIERKGMKLERKSISANIESLIDYGYDIIKTKKGCYLGEREFEKGELRLLIDSVLFSKHIQATQASHLINKLKKFGNIHFAKTITNVNNISKIYHSFSPELFMKIEDILDAIFKNRKIEFIACDYGIDKKKHPISDVKIINPYRLIYQNGYYFLIGNKENKNDISTFRLDKITNVKITDDTIKPQSETDMKYEELNNYIITHPYLLPGKSEIVKLLINAKHIGKIIDSFGEELQIVKSKRFESNNKITVTLKANTLDIFNWVMSNCEIVEVLYPQSIRDRIRTMALPLRNLYLSEDEDMYNNSVLRLEKETKSGKKTSIISHLKMANLAFVNLQSKEEHKNLKNIRKLILAHNKISNFEFLGEYPLLEELVIIGKDVKNLSNINFTENLHKIDFRYTNISDISFLTKIKNLRILTMGYNKSLMDFSPLYMLKNLRLLNISYEDEDKIDVAKLKDIMPMLKININNEYELGRLSGITTNLDYDTMIRKSEGLSMLLDIIFTIKTLNPDDKELLINLINNTTEGKKILNETLNILLYTEEEIVRGLCFEEKTFREIGKELSLNSSLIMLNYDRAIKKLSGMCTGKSLYNFLLKNK